jgi:hypothetical protein
MKRIWSRIVLAAALAGTVLAFGAVPQPAEAARKGCIRIYKPVCALSPKGVRMTYGNACVARAAHAKILHPGKCIGGEFCNFIWIPVCAINPFSHVRQTYPNMCVAEHDNAVWVHNGVCP